MGRAGFVAFDDSRFGRKGQGYVVWSPSPPRAGHIRSGDSTTTDQLSVFLRLDDGSTVNGTTHTLKRVP